jgi:hypothetical protein
MLSPLFCIKSLHIQSVFLLVFYNTLQLLCQIFSYLRLIPPLRENPFEQLRPAAPPPGSAENQPAPACFLPDPFATCRLPPKNACRLLPQDCRLLSKCSEFLLHFRNHSSASVAPGKRF